MKLNSNIKQKHQTILTRYLPAILLIIIVIGNDRTWACSPPPGCYGPDRYVLVAKYDDGNTAARSDTPSNNVIWLRADVSNTIRYSIETYRGSNGYVTPQECGICDLITIDFSQTGGSNATNNGSYYDVTYDGQPVKGQVSATHKGYWCILSPNPRFPLAQTGAPTLTMDVSVVRVTIMESDVTTDKIKVKLEPSTSSGGLQVELQGEWGEWYTISSKATKSGGEYTFNFNIPNMTEGNYTIVSADWFSPDSHYSISGISNYHINVLGNFRITRYGLTDEDGCSQSPNNFSYTTGDCSAVNCNNWYNTTAKNDWLSEVNENGSGRGISGNHYTREGWCSGGQYTPKFRRIGSIFGCPQCYDPYSYLIANETVARWNGTSRICCGDKLYLHGYGKKNSYGPRTWQRY